MEDRERDGEGAVVQVGPTLLLLLAYGTARQEVRSEVVASRHALATTLNLLPKTAVFACRSCLYA